DHCRLLFQWNTSPKAGFTTGASPWMRVHDNYRDVDASEPAEEHSSGLSFWKNKIQFRKRYSELLCKAPSRYATSRTKSC
ncbi:hypothetical protein V1524DRAFT_370345, partial [Lipomyces starkeyi]